MKRILQKIIMVVIVVLSMCSMSSCERKYCERLFLNSAYEAGVVTVEHLKSIAYYYNNYSLEEKPEPDFDLIPMEKLSLYNKYRIIQSHLYHQNIIDVANFTNIETFKYYGTYNGWAAVHVFDDIVCYDPMNFPYYEIGGVVFYDYDYRIVLYKIH